MSPAENALSAKGAMQTVHCTQEAEFAVGRRERIAFVPVSKSSQMSEETHGSGLATLELLRRQPRSQGLQRALCARASHERASLHSREVIYLFIYFFFEKPSTERNTILSLYHIPNIYIYTPRKSSRPVALPLLLCCRHARVSSYVCVYRCYTYERWMCV